MTDALLAVAAAVLLDVTSTIFGLKYGLREANPLMARLQDRFPPGGWVVIKVAATAALCAYSWREQYAPAIWIVAAITGAIAVNNFRLIRRKRTRSRD
ncbi:DUF5658 family protein [Roseivivax isoporae]|uniref:DUF5658 domain-containing protein n=1 Tax=Roseivivax isoporae LMG 25204 TaxID=1449351 RepID=X7F1J8_9RHOB|nr:DUF5658 family protein [Roseivivax isoporae]ETX26645.1 hypothetical protein RISW2_21590 [Roseivivax isoporae LMG 25204]